jgi:hypothetical protein
MKSDPPRQNLALPAKAISIACLSVTYMGSTDSAIRAYVIPTQEEFRWLVDQLQKGIPPASE